MAQTTLKQNQMKGMGAWTAFTPSWTNLTVGAGGTSSGAYMQIGKTVHFRAYFKFGTGSSVGTNVFIVLPVTVATYPAETNIGLISLMDYQTATYTGWLTNGGLLIIGNASGTYLSGTLVTATVPFTWTTNDEIRIQGTYEAA